jgi:hypothetical protein
LTPDFLHLAAEQQMILKRLAEPGNHLVTGPPGSGKSVLAVHQAAISDLSGQPTTLLARSKLLGQHLRAATTTLGSTVEIKTFHKWVHDWHLESAGRSLGGRPGTFNWTYLVEVALRNTARREHTLVIDEGQDLPPEFYQLCRFIGARLLVFADECQRITETQSTLEEIKSALGVSGQHEITHNLRNSYQIAALARQFHVGLHPPPLPAPEGPMPVLLHRPEPWRPFVRWLTNYATTHPTLSIGVVVKLKSLQLELLGDIERTSPGLHPQIYVGDAPTDRHRNIDPVRPGIRLVNRASVKGLEFGTVIVPDAHLDSGDPTAADLRMLYYVLVTRTRGQLYLCYSGDREPPIVADVPERLLRRELLAGRS